MAIVNKLHPLCMSLLCVTASSPNLCSLLLNMARINWLLPTEASSHQPFLLNADFRSIMTSGENHVIIIIYGHMAKETCPGTDGALVEVVGV